MTIALVGSVGAVSVGTSGAAVTPAWGTSENRTAGNLLLLHVAVTGSATLPTTPSGWSVGITRAGTSCSAAVFYKKAAGADAAPTVAAITSGIINARLSEFSGTAIGLTLTSVASGTTSPQKATNASADPANGSLMVSTMALLRSSASTLATDTATYTNATATSTSNSATSTASHYNFGYGLTTAHASANADSQAFTTTSVTGVAVALATFREPLTATATATDTSTRSDTAVGVVVSGGPPPLTLIAAYAFDEGTGTTTADASGNGHTLNPFGGNNPGWTTGHSGNAIAVSNGGDEYFGFAATPQPTVLFAGAWTASFWAYGGGGQDTGVFLAYGDGTGDYWLEAQDISWNSGFSSANMLVYGHSHWNDTLVTFSGGWAHIAVTFDGTSTLKMYANGTLIETVSSGLTLPTYFSSGVTRFGVTLGTVDDLRFYNYAVTGAQVGTLMSTSVGTTADPLSGGGVPTIAASDTGNTVPTGVVAGDLILYAAYMEPANEGNGSATYGTITPPLGFTTLPISPVSSNDANLTTSNTQRSYVAYKWAVGTESGATADFSSNLGSGVYYEPCGVVVIRGAVDTSGGTSGTPFFEQNSAGTASGAGNFPTVSLTTAAADSLLVWFGTDWDSSQGNTLSGWAQTGRNAGVASTQYKTQTAAGATGSLIFVNGGGSGHNLLTSMLLSFRAALVGGPASLSRTATDTASPSDSAVGVVVSHPSSGGSGGAPTIRHSYPVGAGGNGTVTVDTDLLATDRMYLFGISGDWVTGPTLTGTFTGTWTQRFLSADFPGGDNGDKFAWMYSSTVGAQAGTAFTVSTNGSGGGPNSVDGTASLVQIEYSGEDSEIPDGYATVSSGTSLASSIAVDSISPTVAADLLISAYCWSHDPQVKDTSTTPTGFTTPAYMSTITNEWVGGYWASKTLTASGATGTTTWANSAARELVGLQFAIPGVPAPSHITIRSDTAVVTPGDGGGNLSAVIPLIAPFDALLVFEGEDDGISMGPPVLSGAAFTQVGVTALDPSTSLLVVQQAWFCPNPPPGSSVSIAHGDGSGGGDDKSMIVLVLTPASGYVIAVDSVQASWANNIGGTLTNASTTAGDSAPFLISAIVHNTGAAAVMYANSPLTNGSHAADGYLAVNYGYQQLNAAGATGSRSHSGGQNGAGSAGHLITLKQVGGGGGGPRTATDIASPSDTAIAVVFSGSTPKPIAAYNFNENTGTTSADVTGNGHTATIASGAWQSGHTGGGIGGVSNAATATPFTFASPTAPFTMMCWGKVSGIGSYYSFILRTPNTGSTPSCQITVNDHGQLYGGSYYGEAGGSATVAVANTWYHMAVTYDGTTVRFYVNGVQDGISGPMDSRTPGFFASGDTFTMGVDSPVTVDDVRFFGAALSASQITALMNTPVASALPTALAALSFDENSGITAADSTGNGHTATLAGSAAWTSSGHTGSAIAMTSSYGSAQLAGTSTLKPTTAISVMAWVYKAAPDPWGTTTYQPAVSKTLTSTGDSATLYAVAGNNAPGFHVTTSAGNAGDGMSSTTSLSTGWHHLCGTWDGTTVKLYIDGVLDSSAALGGTITYDDTYAWEAGGASHYSQSTRGRVDDVRIFGVALSAADITTFMNTPVAGVGGGPASLSRTATDTASPSDIVVRTLPKTRTATDTAASSDVAARAALVLVRTVTDSSTHSEVAGGPGTRARAAVDIASPSDTATRTQTKIRTDIDTAAPTDTAPRSLGYSRTLTDPRSPGDTPGRGVVSRGRSAAHGAPPTPTLVTSGHGQNSASDVAVSSDVVGRTPVLVTRTAPMATSPSDVASRSMTTTRTGTDSAAHSDVAARTVQLGPRTATDTASPADSVVRASLIRTRTASDLTSPSDTVTATGRGQNSANDVSVPSDVASRSLVLVGRTVTDSSVSTTTAVAARGFSRTATDSFTSTTLVGRTLYTVRTGTDQATPSDSAAGVVVLYGGGPRTAIDVSVSTQAATRTLVLVTRPVVDTTSPSDLAVRATLTRVRTVVDFTAPTDVATGLVTGPPVVGGLGYVLIDGALRAVTTLSVVRHGVARPVIGTWVVVGGVKYPVVT